MYIFHGSLHRRRSALMFRQRVAVLCHCELRWSCWCVTVLQALLWVPGMSSSLFGLCPVVSCYGAEQLRCSCCWELSEHILFSQFPFNPSILDLCCCGKGMGFGRVRVDLFFANPFSGITDLYLFGG